MRPRAASRATAFATSLLVVNVALAAALTACEPVSSPPPATTSDAGPLVSAEPLTPIEIYRRLSPSVAFVETPTGTGSGLLMNIGNRLYVVTNAHVVWPYPEARVAFPNREEHIGVAVANADQLVDLAILGPIYTAIPPLPLSQDREFTTGMPVYLIGYPGESEVFPYPAISQGVLSRTRTWEALGSLHYYQTDADGAGGQSGGVLASDSGEIIGFSGMLFADAFVLAASGADLSARLQELAQTAVDDSHYLALTEPPTRKKYKSRLENLWDTHGYVIEAPDESELSIEADSRGDLGLALFDTYVAELDVADRSFAGTEAVSATVSTEGPQFLLVEQYEPEAATYTLESSHRLARVVDPDDGRQILFDEIVTGNIDYPGDIDWYVAALERGDTITALAESIAIDPVVAIGWEGAGFEAYQEDDDSGRGMLGANALLSYRTRRSGDFLVVVRAFSSADLGGYLLTVSETEGTESQ